MSTTVVEWSAPDIAQLFATFQMGEGSFLVSLVAGGLAGTAVDISLFPLDTIKTRLQSRQVPALVDCMCKQQCCVPAGVLGGGRVPADLLRAGPRSGGQRAQRGRVLLHLRHGEAGRSGPRRGRHR